MKGEKLGEFEEVLLLSLRLHRDAAGALEVQAALEQEARRKASLGAIYTALERLERKGYVESWRSEPAASGGARARRLYRVTRSGAAALAASRDIREGLWSKKGSRAAASR